MDKFARFKHVSTGERLQNTANMRAYVDECMKSLKQLMEEMQRESISVVSKLTSDIEVLRDEINRLYKPRNTSDPTQ